MLHTHNPKPGLYGRAVGRLAHVPVIVNTVHGLYASEDDAWTRRGPVYTLEAVAARFSDVELIQNPEDLALMQRLHLTKNARLLGNGVDLTRFDVTRFSAGERRAARTAIGARDDTIVVGAAGRLVAEKGYPELFEAMAALDPARYLLVVAGAEDRDKPDALSPEILEAARMPRRGAGRASSRHRDAVRRDGHLRPSISSRGLPARRDGSSGDDTPGRDDRRARVPPGRGTRPHGMHRAGPRRVPRWLRRSRPSATTRTSVAAWVKRLDSERSSSSTSGESSNGSSTPTWRLRRRKE